MWKLKSFTKLYVRSSGSQRPIAVGIASRGNNAYFVKIKSKHFNKLIIGTTGKLVKNQQLVEFVPVNL